MSETPGENDAPARRKQSGAARWFLQVRLAAAFLTILPVGPAATAETDDLAASFGWFPLVGFAIGLVLCAGDRIFADVFGPTLGAILTVTLLTLLTGALHLDAVADTADALGARGDRDRALEIMRDSRTGSFGAIALILVIGLKVAAIGGAGGAQRAAMLYLAPGLGRWAMVAVASGLEYRRPDGAGAAMLSGARRRNLCLATIVAIIAIAPLTPIHAARAAIIAAVAALALRAFYRRWLGGVTGDLIGAAGELAETAVLLGLAL